MDETSKVQIEQLQKVSKTPLLVAVDQEGGTVQRYKSQGLLPGATDMARLTAGEAYALYLADGQYLKEQGITTNFAPVVDVESRAVSPLPGRLFSSDPDVVSTYAQTAIDALRSAGIHPVLKHFPGLGSGSRNTDFGVATTDQFSTFEQRDLVPYQKLAAEQPDVMVGNMIVPGLTNGQPAVWSSEAVQLLRSIGYKDAVVYSDSLTAQAIPGTIEDASLEAWQAGIDVALIVQGREQTGTIETLISTITGRGVSGLAAGEFNKESLEGSVKRILARKNIDPCTLAGNY